MLLLPPSVVVPPVVANAAVRQLAHADYTIATKISEDVALFVPWALEHHWYWAADHAMALLQTCESIGNVWIQMACWLVLHTH